MALRWPFKDPDEVLDYEIDWSGRLNGDTISASEWTVPTGLVKETVGDHAESKTETTTKVWLSSGTVGQVYEVQNRVETAAGRTMDQTVKLKIKVK